MSGRDHKSFVRSAFEPLADAAGRLDLLEKLLTEPIPDNRKDEQYARFNSFEVDQSDVVYLPNGGFVALYSHRDGRYLGISSAGLIAKDETDILMWAADRHLEQESFDECTFLCFAHHLKGYYRLTDRFRAAEDALNVIDVVSDNYIGHAFSELILYYRPVLVFQIPQDSLYSTADIFRFAAELCCNNEAVRSAIIDQELASALFQLIESSPVPNENLFQAVTASHFRHAFLELYRCLESNFYLPWMIELKRTGGIHTRACELKNTCRVALQWREKELPSMEKLFALVPRSEKLDNLEDAVELFKDLKNGGDFTRNQIGKRLYTIRNGMVHHEDYEEPNQYKPNDVQWRFLSLYVAHVLLAITSTYARDLTPTEKEFTAKEGEALALK